jgi:hypothetical protein
MIFGYNTDVKAGDTVYHVQTEDRGEKHPVIDSVIYRGGRIVDRRRTSYQPGETTSEQLQEMVKRQHRELVEAIRGGTYVEPEKPPPPAPAKQPAPAPAAPASPALELTNARDIVQDGQLLFQLRVRDRANGQPLSDTVVRAVLAPGEEQETRGETTTSAEGIAEIRFDPPAAEEGVVLFHTAAGGASEVLKFRLLRHPEE